MATSQGAQGRSLKQMTSEISGAPSPAEVSAIRSAIAEGRQKAAVRLLGEANLKWRLQLNRGDGSVQVVLRRR